MTKRTEGSEVNCASVLQEDQLKERLDKNSRAPMSITTLGNFWAGGHTTQRRDLSSTTRTISAQTRGGARMLAKTDAETDAAKTGDEARREGWRLMR